MKLPSFIYTVVCDSFFISDVLTFPYHHPFPLIIILWITISFTCGLITWKLDTGLPAIWFVIFIPVWVDVICGVFILWNACPLMDAAEVEGNIANSYMRSMLLSTATFHFFMWGIQGVLIAMKLDHIETCEWHTILFMWIIVFIVMAIKILHLSLLLALPCYSKLLHYWESLSCNQKFMVVETTVALILTWSWVFFGFITFPNIVVRYCFRRIFIFLAAIQLFIESFVHACLKETLMIEKMGGGA